MSQDKTPIQNIPTFYVDGFNQINLSPSVTKIQFVLVENDESGAEIKVPTFNLAISTDSIMDLARKMVNIIEENKEAYKNAVIDNQNKILGENQ